MNEENMNNEVSSAEETFTTDTSTEETTGEETTGEETTEEVYDDGGETQTTEAPQKPGRVISFDDFVSDRDSE